MPNPHVTPFVAKLAAEYDVPLGSVVGTGVGGRISAADVRRAAGQRTPVRPRPQALLPMPAASGSKLTFMSRFDGRQRVELDPYAPNPLLDDLRQVAPASVQAATRGGPPPTLFMAGDVPPFTASGNDPRELLRLPWMLRHSAARADQKTWAHLFDAYGTDPDAASITGEAQHPENDAYRARLSTWASTSGLPGLQ